MNKSPRNAVKLSKSLLMVWTDKFQFIGNAVVEAVLGKR